MAAQSQQWINVDQIVAAYLDESEQGIHKKFKCKQLAIRAGRELGLDSFAPLKSIKVAINPNRTANLPPDCWKYTKIGVFNSAGEMVTFKKNDSLTQFQDNYPTRLEEVQDNNVFNQFGPGSPFYANYYWNDNCYTLYGVPSGSPYTPGYSVDEAKGIVILPEDYPFSYIVIEYIGFTNENNEYTVPIQFYEAVLSYIRWKDIISLPASTHVQLSDKQIRRKEYFNERRLAIARYKPIYLQDAFDWSVENQRLVPKA